MNDTVARTKTTRALAPGTAPTDALLGGIRLRSLIVIRWLAITGQVAAVLIVLFGFGFDFPVLACVGVITASVVLNIVAFAMFPANKRLSDRDAALYLAFDIIQLSTLLSLTGGLQNPFAILVLAPVAISASSLSGRSTIVLVGLALICVSGLGLVSLPLPWVPGETLVMPLMYQVGIWAGLVLSIVFLAAYAWRIAFETRSMSEALTATRFVLAREQRLSAVGGLAAAAAHELGTPLGTIALVANDLADNAAEDGDMKEDVGLLLSQVDRCRKILRQLSADPHIGDAVYDTFDLGTLLHELADSVPAGAPLVRVHLLPHDRFAEGEELIDEPVLARRPEIIYGLGNILNNAVDFASSEVVMKADWTDTQLSVEISDDGPGFAAQLIDRLGEPYLTTRPGRGVNIGRGDHEGLGLGIFIAKTLLGRAGGVTQFYNKGNGQGAVVLVTWPNGILDEDVLVDGVAHN